MTFARTREHMERALTQGIFTGAVLRVSRNGRTLLHESYGALGGPGTAAVTIKTLFDLASLTKVLSTTPCWMRLTSRIPGILDQPLYTWFPDAPADKRSITPRQLLAHSSGLPAWRPYYLYDSGWTVNRLVAEKIFQEDLAYPTGQGCVYSDLGFIVLAAIVEKETGKPLDQLVRDEIFTPLKLSDDLGFNLSEEKHRMAWTREGEAPGQVNDLNARSLGGVSGHAGLFGTAEAVAEVAEEILKGLTGQSGMFDSETVRTFCQRAQLVADSTRALGFDTPSEEGSSSGKHFSAQSLGHTGFTGTSLWIDPSKGIVVVLLTNRVFRGEPDMRIKAFRPQIHDAIMEEIGEGW
jgi:serine-type D-Ala-D-Ala carboxypeptidase